jgi:membrane protein implicated in regulation of membrane protease activity
MALWTLWWVWIAFALILALIEIMLPGFIALGFALGAMIVGVLVGLGFSPSLPLGLAMFAGFSLLSWLALRLYFAPKTGDQVKTFDYDIND